MTNQRYTTGSDSNNITSLNVAAYFLHKLWTTMFIDLSGNFNHKGCILDILGTRELKYSCHDKIHVKSSQS